MFSMALIPCPTHDSCDLCSKKIIYVQMWREKVTSLIAKTSCDWYKFNIRGHFPTPGGALWLVYPGQLPGNRAGSQGQRRLCKQTRATLGADRKELLRQGWEPAPPNLPQSFTQTLHRWNPVTTTFTETSDMDKDIKQEKCILKSYIQNKGTATEFTWTAQTVTFVCVLHLSLFKQINDNRFFFTLYCTPLKWFQYNFLFWKIKLFSKAKRGHCHISMEQHCDSQQNAFNFLATLNVCSWNLQQHWTGSSSLRLNSS